MLKEIVVVMTIEDNDETFTPNNIYCRDLEANIVSSLAEVDYRIETIKIYVKPED